jgi:TPR repeat protein
MFYSIIRMSGKSGSGDPGEARASPGSLNAWNNRTGRQELESLRLLADQGNAVGQWRYGVCLRDGIGISKDLKGAAHYLKPWGQILRLLLVDQQQFQKESRPSR